MMCSKNKEPMTSRDLHRYWFMDRQLFKTVTNFRSCPLLLHGKMTYGRHMLVRKCVLYIIFHIDLLKGVWVALAGFLGGGSGVLYTPLYSYKQLTVTSNTHRYSPYTQDQRDKDHSLLVIYKSIIQHLRVYIYHISHLAVGTGRVGIMRSEEHTSELQSRETISYAVFCLKKKNK